eukprot:TRINITY_DN3233_c0_g1_i2.p1 TRINITY_DN3233_c0_g1~~TRINITY_DN3233_c0_g1_i2.p1  ORF type:complete len:351 (+),score=62.19 TRINITY_DN3233_c0_g1_i2:46-1098(+)
MPRILARRTDRSSRDVQPLASHPTRFADMLLPQHILDSLSLCGFSVPSPVQQSVIPIARLGIDVIAQAKAGTGKTLAFGVPLLEQMKPHNQALQALVLSPTREIAYQTHGVLHAIGSAVENLCCSLFIGGTAMQTDAMQIKHSHVAVGTPGRIRALIEGRFLDPTYISIMVLDEADKLMEESYREDTTFILESLPKRRQTIAVSATFPNVLLERMKKLMNEPQIVRIDDEAPSLQGVSQFYHIIGSGNIHDIKMRKVLELLDGLSFHQCLIFTNARGRAEEVTNILVENGWPARFIAGHQAQSERIESLKLFKEFRLRVLVSTDLVRSNHHIHCLQSSPKSRCFFFRKTL